MTLELHGKRRRDKDAEIDKICILEGLIFQPYLKSFNSNIFLFKYYENTNIDTLFLCQEQTRPFQN